MGCVYSIASQHLATNRISGQDINIPKYCISRKDATVTGQIDIAVYIHISIADITHRLQDLQNDLVEPNMNAPTVFVFLCTETLLSVSYESFDDFVI